ncbi:hypothetical protein PTTG_02743 [Puccinia triticina 1-1 BBBD Race 1]|uniref:Pentatricopeptide repeat-containing protein-mitochondrial domain-containing protein n=1 Tax=Puccinia triticina (isolate 1-1 / race 1 (BBBD)) TaxID=630390 RepID=A0A180GWH4_PUCT1|nr:hypothetical protein PTTG_02743 [Puccinia triticina 1-1 BBBD Race 1]
MRRIRSNHPIRHPNHKTNRATFYHLPLQSGQLSTCSRTITDNRSKPKTPENHPLKFFTEFRSQHQIHPARPDHPPPSCHNQHHHSYSLNHPLRHYFHVNHHHSNQRLHTPVNGGPSSIDLFINSNNSGHPNRSWWQCSLDHRDVTRGDLKGTVHQKLKLKCNRNESFQNYVSELVKIQSFPKNSTLTPVIQSVTSLLKDSKFQNYFDQIWSDLNSNEENDKEEKFRIIELQRKSIEIFLQTMINSLSSDVNLPQAEKSQIFNAVIYFLVTNKNSDRVVSTLGLDPVRGWRNLIKEHLRIQTLKTLVTFINLFNPNLSTWWSSEISQAQSESAQLGRLAQAGLFLIVALSKEGSVWKALELFWMMDRLPRIHGFSGEVLPYERRAATALGLVDALRSRKRIDAANDILEVLLVGEWLGPLYQRYLLSMLMVKATRGELPEVVKIGQAYQRTWASTNEIEDVAGRNKRSRAFHLQDPRILVARAKIEALGMLGETRSAIDIFQETMRTVPPKLGVSSQLPDLYAEIMKVYMKADNPRAIERLLARMISTPDHYGLNQPDQRHYNTLLQAYANRVDIEGCSSVLDRLISSGIRPDIYTFGNICLLFSNLGEPELIREVIQALAEHRSPSRSLKLNRELWNILLDAYIESGDWTRAAKLLKYLELNDHHRNESDAVTNGCVLKALVLSGSPTEKVLETFKSMYNSQTGLAADTRSYTLLLLSICDSGMMDLAETVFYSLKENNLNGDGQIDRLRGSVKPNVYMYGIMISASLRLGKHDLAHGYLREMQSSGIRPNLVIYSMLTTAYAASASSSTQIQGRAEGEEDEEERQEDGVRVAYEMADRFKRELLGNEVDGEVSRKPPTERATWGERPLMRKKLLHRLLGPIIQSYAKSARPAKALEMFRELVSSLGAESGIVSSDGKPIDLDIFTMLMDGYRRAQDPVGVMEVWREIFRLATENNQSQDASEQLIGKVISLIKNDGLPAGGTGNNNTSEPPRRPTAEQRHRRKANKLCLPLSIYTDCLSRHGYHEEIAKSWHEVQARGFGFDAGNWNELCAAMFRSGNHRMGWWIAERVFFGKEADPGEALETGAKVDDSDEMNWARLLERTTGFRFGRTVLGLEGTRLSGAQKTESPIRPPNRTFIRKTRRFDDESATRMSVQGLLNWLENPDSTPSVHDGYTGSHSGWSQQLDHISQARRELGWRPSGKVLRMLHGSMWRECSDWVIGKWEEVEAKATRGEDRMRLEGSLVDDKDIMKAPVQEIVDGYQSRYPNTMVEVMTISDTENIPVGLSNEQVTRWCKDDFIIRVIGRTLERIRE